MNSFKQCSLLLCFALLLHVIFADIQPLDLHELNVKPDSNINNNVKGDQETLVRLPRNHHRRHHGGGGCGYGGCGGGGYPIGGSGGCGYGGCGGGGYPSGGGGHCPNCGGGGFGGSGSFASAGSYSFGKK